VNLFPQKRVFLGEWSDVSTLVRRAHQSDAAEGCGENAQLTRLAGKTTTVVADAGTTAEVLVFPPGARVSEGARFSHRGTTWVVTGKRRDSGVLVAEPTPH
jgi:uncharacterized RmlC-like cupin family protein